MVDFKKGDRVRVVKEPYPGGSQVGDEGVVRSIKESAKLGEYPVVVVWDSCRRQSGFYPDEIELIQ